MLYCSVKELYTKVLKDILFESKAYYLQILDKIEAKLSRLPKESVKERAIAGKKYYYLQKRSNGKVVHKYLGKEKPEELIKQIKQRQALQHELKQVKGALKILSKAKQ